MPGDLSSAAFLIAAGVLVPGSRLVLEGVGVNWTRTGFLRILERMGAIVLGELEPAGGVRRRRAGLRSRRLATARSRRPRSRPTRCRWRSTSCRWWRCSGCFAEGETVVRGAGELRVKESDRIATVVDGLRGLGRRHRGASTTASRCAAPAACAAGAIDAHGDHRLALLGAVAGLASRGGRRGDRDGGRRRLLSRVRRRHRARWRALMVVAIDGPAGAGKSTRGPRRGRRSSASPTWTPARCTAAVALAALRARRRAGRGAPRG